MRAWGYEYSTRVELSVLGILGVSGELEGGNYSSLAYPELSVDNYRAVRTVDFSELRGQDSYTWYRYKVGIDIPLLAAAMQIDPTVRKA